MILAFLTEFLNVISLCKTDTLYPCGGRKDSAVPGNVNFLGHLGTTQHFLSSALWTIHVDFCYMNTVVSITRKL